MGSRNKCKNCIYDCVSWRKQNEFGKREKVYVSKQRKKTCRNIRKSTSNFQSVINVLKSILRSLHILCLKYIDPHTLFFHCGSDAFYYRKKKEVLKMQVKIWVEIPYLNSRAISSWGCTFRFYTFIFKIVNTCH